MRKLSIRKRGGHSFEVGPTNGDVGSGRTVMVVGQDKRDALQKGRPLWKKKYDTRATKVET